jgi:hypothetical protein
MLWATLAALKQCRVGSKVSILAFTSQQIKNATIQSITWLLVISFCLKWRSPPSGREVSLPVGIASTDEIWAPMDIREVGL